MALGVWGESAVSALALGPLIGGAVVSGISWHWIFWINVPVGLVLVPLALTRLTESRGPAPTWTCAVSASPLPGCSGSPTA